MLSYSIATLLRSIFTLQVPDVGRIPSTGVCRVASSGRDIFAARQFAQHSVPTKRSVLLAEVERVSGLIEQCGGCGGALQFGSDSLDPMTASARHTDVRCLGPSLIREHAGPYCATGPLALRLQDPLVSQQVIVRHSRHIEA